MMLRNTFMLLLVCLFLAAGTAGAAGEYQSGTSYPGIYKAERLYQLDAQKSTWYASKEYADAASLACRTARTTLKAKGTWVGNLSRTGECLGDAEAPTWATGNYLNYLINR